MCGIAGITSGVILDEPERLVERMLSVQRHRGPDEAGMYLSPHTALGHVRLSIIGIDGGAQPIGNESGSVWIVFNGEIFNYVELRESLRRLGHRFATDTDTEVIVHLYEEYGIDCLPMLNGQFAFALWDAPKQLLFLARDRVGIRPLYYTGAGSRFLFASEIKALFQDPEVPRELDPEALSQVFTLWSTFAPRTPFRGVRQLRAGHYLLLQQGEASEKAYWEVPDHSGENLWQGTADEAADALRDLLADAVRLRLRADVPVGAYLSGGLDSSILVSLMKRQREEMSTFSLSFQEGTFDESPFQQEVACFLGTAHSSVPVTNRAIAEGFPEVVSHCETPLLRTAPVPMAMLSRLVRANDYKVILTGEGADEIFGGYNIFKEAKVRDFWGRSPGSLLRPLLLERLYPYVFTDPARGRAYLQRFFGVDAEMLRDPFFSHRIRWNAGARNQGFLSRNLLEAVRGYDPVDEVAAAIPETFFSRPLLSRAQVLEMKVFLSNYLLSSQGDRVAMANSVELRHPFLDYRVVDFAFRVPEKWKLRGMNEKYILKKTFASLLPASVTARNKQPFRAPIREVFFGEGAPEYVADLLSERKLKDSGYFDVVKARGLAAKFAQSAAMPGEWQNMALVGILSTQVLHDKYIAEAPRAAAAVVPDRVVRQRRERRI